jgi:hypothetical protein
VTDIEAFRAFVEGVERCWPRIEEPLHCDRSLGAGPPHTFTLHGLSATSHFGTTGAARFWLFRARNLLGGFPEPALKPLPLREWQLEWAEAHVMASRPENDALLAQACAIILALSANQPLRSRAEAWQAILSPDPKGTT